MSDVVVIVPYRDEYRADFDRLNRAWVSAHLVVEPGDDAELSDPHGYFVAGGGQVLFLLTASGQVAGTVALANHGATWELAKMTVDAAYRGNGYGDRLVIAAIEYAQNAGATAIELVSNTKLKTAIRLYRKHGFGEIPLEPGETYARANIRMRRGL